MCKRKFLSLLLALAMVVPMTALFAIESAANTSGDLQFREDGTFKIVHFSDFQERTSMNNMTKQFIQAVMRQEQPDLVVLGGDNVGGFSGTAGSQAESSRLSISQFMDIFEFFGVPVAPVFGNHDAEQGSANRTQQRVHYNTYSVSRIRTEASAGGNDISNYNLPIRGSGGAVKFNLWFFDCNANDTSTASRWGHVTTNALTWYQNTSDSLKAANGNKVVPSIAFQHIVPPEIYAYINGRFGGSNGNNWNAYNGAAKDYPGENWNYMREKPCPPNTPTVGPNPSQVSRFATRGDVLAVVVGHDHENNYRLKHATHTRGIDLMCTGTSGFGNYPWNHDTRESQSVRMYRAITIYEDRANTSPADIETSPGRFIDYLDQGKLLPLETAHNLSEWQVRTPGNCVTPALEYRNCINPGCILPEETRSVTFGNHDLGTWQTRTPANCFEQELQFRECVDCTHEETRFTGEPAAHDMGAWIQTKDPTCVAVGTETQRCTACNIVTGTKDVAIDPAAHDMGAWQTRAEATCGKAGILRRDCANCDAYETKPIAGLVHDYGEWMTSIAASCEVGGQEKRQCANCNAAITREIPAIGHKYGTWTVFTAATCKNAGQEKRVCNVCGAAETREIARKTVHTFGTWTIVTPATCKGAGQEKRVCSVCGAAETREIIKTDHIDTDGDGKCDYCGIDMGVIVHNCKCRFKSVHDLSTFLGRFICSICRFLYWILKWVFFGWIWL